MMLQTTDLLAPNQHGETTSPKINPWLFVPVLYFMQAIPYFMVTETYGTAFKSMGIDNLQIALWTGIAACPWVFKMFWAPLVDLNSTKRKWTLSMQAMLAVLLGATAALMTTSAFFGLTVGGMFLIATFSATHDIACDGLYLMSLDRTRQAAFSGVMAACFRLGRLFAASLVVFMAGRLIRRGMTAQNAWAIALGIIAIVYAAGMVWNMLFLPRPAADVLAADVVPGERRRNIIRALTVVGFGVALYYFLDGALQLVGYIIYTHVPAGRVPQNWDLIVDSNTDERLPQYLKLALCTIALPVLWRVVVRQLRGTQMGDALVSYVRQPRFGAILGFIIFYRFGEAMVFAMARLFFLDAPDKGGMGISLEALGVIQGVGQVGGLIIGGLLGGWFISRVGLRRAFWPLVVCMHLPNVLYIWLAYKIPGPHWAYPVVFGEAFGYGFGFAGYFVYLMQVAQRGRFVTTHYAMGTSLGALFIIFATIIAGIVQAVFGYLGVFIAACLFTVPGTLTLLFIPLDKSATRLSASSASGH